jgi:hypothetical protein
MMFYISGNEGWEKNSAKVLLEYLGFYGHILERILQLCFQHQEELVDVLCLLVHLLGC